MSTARVNRVRRLQRVEAERGLVVERLVDGDVPVGPHGGQRRDSPSRSRSPRSARCRPTTSSSRDRRTTGAPSRARAPTRCACARASDASFGSTSRSRLAVEDRRRVLHRAGREVRHGEHVELAERILDGEVACCRTSGSAAADSSAMRPISCLPPAPQIRIGMLSADASRHSKSADGHRHQIRRHLRRRRELDGVRVPSGSRRVGDDPAVRDRRVAAVDRQRRRRRSL